MNWRLESWHFPHIPIQVQLRGRNYEIEALIDTGFDGDVTIPPSLVDDDESADPDAHARLADGSGVTMSAYLAEIRVGQRQPFPIALLLLGMNRPLAGVLPIAFD